MEAGRGANAQAQAQAVPMGHQMYGFLWKLPTSRKHSRWVRRFFIIYDGFLLYYVDRVDVGAFDPHVKGAFPLGGCSVSTYTVSLPSKQDTHAFAISHPTFGERMLVLAAESIRDRDDWIAAVRDCRHVTYQGALQGARLIEKLRHEGRHMRAQLMVVVEQLKQREEQLSAEIAKRVAVQGLFAALSARAPADAQPPPQQQHPAPESTSQVNATDEAQQLVASLRDQVARLEARLAEVDDGRAGREAATAAAGGTAEGASSNAAGAELQQALVQAQAEQAAQSALERERVDLQLALERERAERAELQRLLERERAERAELQRLLERERAERAELQRALAHERTERVAAQAGLEEAQRAAHAHQPSDRHAGDGRMTRPPPRSSSSSSVASTRSGQETVHERSPTLSRPEQRDDAAAQPDGSYSVAAASASSSGPSTPPDSTRELDAIAASARHARAIFREAERRQQAAKAHLERTTTLGSR